MALLVPQRLGPPWREAIGLLQHPPEPSAQRHAFLLARPMGLAATRSASMYRVLSDRLVRTGASVMRFDYHGTGDSPGEEGDQSLADWSRDVEEAQSGLLHAASPHHTDWFGMGLGANLMLQAALRVPSPPRRLVLWEPIDDGPAHLQALLVAHRREMVMQLAQPWDDLIAQGLVREPRVPGVVLGFHIGAQLNNDLQNLPALTDWLPLAAQRGMDVTVCATESSLNRWSRDLPTSVHGRLQWVPLQTATHWMSSEAMGAAVVPPEIHRILEVLTR